MTGDGPHGLDVTAQAAKGARELEEFEAGERPEFQDPHGRVPFLSGPLDGSYAGPRPCDCLACQDGPGHPTWAVRLRPEALAAGQYVANYLWSDVDEAYMLTYVWLPYEAAEDDE